MGRDVSGAHTEASHPCFMMLASDFSRDALENRPRSFQAPAHEKNPHFYSGLNDCSHFYTPPKAGDRICPTQLVYLNILNIKVLLIMIFKLVLVLFFSFYIFFT